jgi:hypothetical protein
MASSAQSIALGETMRRRKFIQGIAGSAIAWPFATRAQQSTMPVVGYLFARADHTSPIGILQRTGRDRVYRRPKGISLGAHRRPSLAGIGRRPRSPPSECHCDPGQHASGTRGQGSDHNDTGRIRHRPGSGPSWSRKKSEPTGRQYYGGQLSPEGNYGKAAWFVARTATESRAICFTCQSKQSEY